MESSIDPETRVGAFGGRQSIVAIARALAFGVNVLVLDEPTAALPAGDVDLLLDKLKRLRASGIGLLYVTHRLDEVFRIADRVTVLRDGRRIATQRSRDFAERLVSWIVGGALAETTIAKPPASAAPLLAVERVGGRRRRRGGSGRPRIVCHPRRRDTGAGGPARRRATTPSVGRFRGVAGIPGRIMLRGPRTPYRRSRRRHSERDRFRLQPQKARRASLAT